MSAFDLPDIEEKILSNIDHVSERFHHWDKVLYEYIVSHLHLSDNFELRYQQKVVIEMGNLLCELFYVCADSCLPKNAFKEPSYICNYLGMDCCAIFPKFGTHMFLGYDITKGICLSTEIPSPCLAARLKDDFWWLFSSLFDYGDVCFQLEEVPQPLIDTKVLVEVRRSKSAFFSFVTNFLLHEIECNDENPDLGQIEIHWPQNKGWAALIWSVTECIRRLYKMNYLVYRVSYLNEKAKSRFSNNDKE